mgnify:CR=1 FL=1
MDTETSGFSKLVFDFGWTTITAKGEILGECSLNFLDVLCVEKPYYHNKIARYARDQRKGAHKVTTFAVGRRLFNLHISHLKSAGYRVILCAYNAGFDCRALNITTKRMKLGNKFLSQSVELLDIWGNWAISAPKAYTAPPTASGKFYSTSAENVYKFEMQMPEFVEAHTAFEDTKIEAQILLKILNRKKRVKVVKNPRDFDFRIWENFTIEGNA